MENTQSERANPEHPAMRALAHAIGETIPVSVELADELWAMSDRLMFLIRQARSSTKAILVVGE